jgi:FkbM family methyltransferase
LQQGRPFVYRRLGTRYLVIPGVPASVASYLNDPEEQRELAIWRAWIEAGDQVIDGGAHTGLYTLSAAENLTRGKVLAIDADENLIATIQRATEVLSKKNVCNLVTSAVGDKDGTAEFFFAAVPAANAVLQSLQDPGGGFVARQVRMQTLATLAETHCGNAIPAAIKLDLEGAEQLALSAAPAAWFGEQGPLWLIELNLEALGRFKHQPEDITRFFPSSAFACYVFSHYPHHGIKLPEVLPLDPPPDWKAAVYFNLIAVPLGRNFAPRRDRIRRWLS